jgi:hypothetical protein
VVPEFGGETSSTAKPKEPISPTQKAKNPAVMPKVPSAELAEPKTNKTEEPRIEGTKILEVLSPSAEVIVSKAQKGLAATPKRKRMASVLDVLESVKASSSIPSGKIAEASKMQIEAETKPVEVEAAVSQASTEARPSEPAEKKPSEIEEKAAEEEVIEQTLPEKVAAPAPEALKESIEYIIRHASGKRRSKEEEREAQHYAQKLKYPKGALVFNGSGEEDFLYCLPDSKEISVCREMGRSFGFPTLEDGLSVLSKDELADSLAYNSIKVRKSIFVFKNELFHLFILNTILLLQGLILSNALRAQKNIEDEGCTIALNNLRSKVIELRNEGLEKDKILISLVSKIKEDEASSKAQAKAQKSEIEDLRKQLVEAKLKCAVAEADRDASEYWKNYFEKTVAELRASKERCFEKSVECVKKIKTSFVNVGAYSNEDNFIRGDPEGVIEWISGEAEAFEEILSDRGDVCAFSGVRGVAAVLEKAGCEHVKTLAQVEDAFSVDDTKDPSAEASLIGGKIFTDIWENGGRGMAHEIMKKSEKDIHDAREATKEAEKAAELERRIGIT